MFLTTIVSKLIWIQELSDRLQPAAETRAYHANFTPILQSRPS